MLSVDQSYVEYLLFCCDQEYLERNLRDKNDLEKYLVTLYTLRTKYALIIYLFIKYIQYSSRYLEPLPSAIQNYSKLLFWGSV